MPDRRKETRLLCSELLKVRVEGESSQELTANLEDISPSGACLHLEKPIPVDAFVRMHCARCDRRGKVRYCLYHGLGYYAGVQFDEEHKWSPAQGVPQHLLHPSMLAPLDRWSREKLKKLLSDVLDSGGAGK